MKKLMSFVCAALFAFSLCAVMPSNAFSADPNRQEVENRFELNSTTAEELAGTGAVSLEVAKKIAKVIRGSSGGFRSCKAMGFMMEDRGIAQVSMNMVNYEDTPLYVVYEQVRALAERYGTYIVDSEIVGLTPAKAMIDCAEFYLKARDFNCHNQIMEYHLLDMK